jgi:hypothetical protein
MRATPALARPPRGARYIVACAMVCTALALWLAHAPLAQSTQGPTRQIDTVTMAGSKAMTDRFGRRSQPFRADGRDGPVWLVYYFLGEIEGDEDTAEVAFEMFFEGVKMDPRDTFALFRARYMRPVTAKDVEPTAQGTAVPLAAWAGMPSVPEALARSVGAQAAQRLTADAQAFGRLRHVVVANRVPVPPGEDTVASFTMKRTRGFKPLYLRVHIGQGPIPRELEQWSKQTSGSWLVRYRKVVLMVAGFVAAALMLLWWLVRRR